MKKYMILIICGVIMQACKKSESYYRPQSSYTVVNATTDISTIRAYAADHLIPWKTLPASENVAQYRAVNYGAYAGLNHVRAVSNADTNLVIFSSSKVENLEEAKTTMLFLSGNITAGYNGILLLNDNIIGYTDSVFGVRFINLSPNSSPLNITLSTSPGINEASSLAYQQKTGFKTYPSLQTTTTMVFQVRDAGGVLLASYTLPFAGGGTYATAGIANARFKNLTLVIKGLQGTTSGTNALGIFPVSHY